MGRSLPMRECGLKPILSHTEEMNREVTPHAGVWIETAEYPPSYTGVSVTPHAGVWIETLDIVDCRSVGVSLPMRECGLKHKFRF